MPPMGMDEKSKSEQISPLFSPDLKRTEHTWGVPVEYFICTSFGSSHIIGGSGVNWVQRRGGCVNWG